MTWITVREKALSVLHLREAPVFLSVRVLVWMCMPGPSWGVVLTR